MLQIENSERVNIPVCVITDENIPFSVPALFVSILRSTTSNVFYDFYCFVPETLKQQDRERILAVQDEWKDCSVKIIDMGNKYQDSNNEGTHVTNSCLYKFAIIDTLNKYDKALYLDTDILVNGDLKELYDIDLGRNYVGAVFNIWHYVHKQNFKELLEIPDVGQFFNAGVMLMNLKQMREDNLLSELEKHIGTFKGSVDQNIFNKVCYGRILNIPPKFNLTEKNMKYYELPFAKSFYTVKELKEAIENPVIMHYPGKPKPWNTQDLPLSWKWLRCYQESTYRDVALDFDVLPSLRKELFVSTVAANIVPEHKFNNSLQPKKFSKANLKKWLFAFLTGIIAKIYFFNIACFNLKFPLFGYILLYKKYKERNLSPILFVFDNLKDTKENRTVLNFILDRAGTKKIVVLYKKGGKLEQVLREYQIPNYNIRHYNKIILTTLKIFKITVFNGIGLYKTTLKFYNEKKRFVWLLNNDKKTEKFKKTNKMQNIICLYDCVLEDFDDEKLTEALNI